MLANNLKERLKKIGKGSTLDRVVSSFYLKNSLKKQQSPILIYTSPKTGSSTVKTSLQSLYPNVPIYKVHYLSSRNIAISANKYRKENNANPPVIMRSKIIGQEIEANPDLNWRIICLTREPFGRAISALFQIIERRYPEFIDENGDVIIDDAIALLTAELNNFDRESNRICQWFDEELKQVFGIDVYEYPFDYEKGFTIINKDNIQVLVIRLENLSNCFAEAVSNLLDSSQDIQLINRNLSKNKRHFSAYKTCKQKIVLPETVCQKICDSRYVKHFYSEDERKQLIEKYS